MVEQLFQIDYEVSYDGGKNKHKRIDDGEFLYLRTDRGHDGELHGKLYKGRGELQEIPLVIPKGFEDELDSPFLEFGNMNGDYSIYTSQGELAQLFNPGISQWFEYTKDPDSEKRWCGFRLDDEPLSAEELPKYVKSFDLIDREPALVQFDERTGKATIPSQLQQDNKLSQNTNFTIDVMIPAREKDKGDVVK